MSHHPAAWTDWDLDDEDLDAPPPDEVVLRTVGIDIGSSTSHLMFSRLTMKRLGLFLSSRYVVVDRTTLYRSPIMLTPYRGDTTIDAARLGEFIASAYAEAELTSADIDSGALILTGVAAERENAAAIGALFSAEAGKLVSAAAGPRLEALLAAHGSGAVALSRHGTGGQLLNVDIGGGTTKLALVSDGEVLDTAIIGVGARLVVRDSSGTVVRLERDGQQVADVLGLRIALGSTLTDDEAEHIAGALAGAAVEFIGGKAETELTRSLAQTRALDVAGVERLTFSGGLSEYLYGRDEHDHGDLGPALAAALRQRIAAGEVAAPMVEPPEGIRATVVGAGQFTVQLSGDTITISRADLLPLRGLPVAYLRLAEDRPINAQDVGQAVERALARLDITEGEQPVALAIERELEPRYAVLRELAEGLVGALPKTVEARLPIVIVLAGDHGRTLGRIIGDELAVATGVVSIDSIRLQELDHIDIGAPIPPSSTVPVVVRSLLFGSPGR